MVVLFPQDERVACSAPSLPHVDVVVARLATATALHHRSHAALGPATMVSRNGVCKVARRSSMSAPLVHQLPTVLAYRSHVGFDTDCRNGVWTFTDRISVVTVSSLHLVSVLPSL